jgi:GT2 family glycosyltransferase
VKRKSMKRDGAIFIILLNWNNGQDTKECLDSLERIFSPTCKVIIVDNGSVDGSGEKLQREFSRHHFIFNPGNLGFAGGNNRGIQYALDHGANYVLLLNNDTVARNDFIGPLLMAAESDEEVGIVGGKINYYDTPDRVWFGGGRMSLWRAGGYHLGLDQIDDPLVFRGTVNASFVTGCLMLIKREVLERVGLFDEDYFAYLEDLDFCYRVMRGGWRLKVNRDVRILHKVGGSQRRTRGPSPMEIYYGTRNRLFFASKYLSLSEKAVFFSYFFLGRLLRMAQWRAAGERSLSRATYEGWRDFKKGQMGMRKGTRER